jgi:hypothetical protein
MLHLGDTMPKKKSKGRPREFKNDSLHDYWRDQKKPEKRKKPKLNEAQQLLKDLEDAWNP